MCHKATLPDMESGRCQGPEGNGVSLGEGGEGGPGPPEGRKDKHQRSARKEATWSRKKKERQVGRGKEGPGRTE